MHHHHHHHTTCYGAPQPELSSALHKTNDKKQNKMGPKNGKNTVSVQEMNVKIKVF